MGADIRLFAVLLSAAVCTASCKDESPFPGSSADDGEMENTGSWIGQIPVPDRIRYVRPPEQQYGAGDGSSWSNAYSGLPERRERGTQYYFAAGEYHDSSLGQVETYVLDDEDDGSYIWLIKATVDDHGENEGFYESFGQGPALMGPLSFIEGHYVVDGQEGAGKEGYGIVIRHRDCELREMNFVASPIFFPWNSTSEHILLRHLEIEDCGNYDDQEIRSQDSVYGVNPVSRIVVSNSYIHDSWRNHMFLQDAYDIVIQDNYFQRAGRHHESNSLAFRNSRNIVIRRNIFVDSMNNYINLQGIRNVTISSNIFTRTLENWSNWAAIVGQGPALNVLVVGNTFYHLEGLNTGIRFVSTTENLLVANNLWAGNRTNQIMMNGEHAYNGFYDNWRVDGEEPVNIDGNSGEETAQIFDEDPFVDALNWDLHLNRETEPGLYIDDPFVQTDLDGVSRGDSPGRGAYEFFNFPLK